MIRKDLIFVGQALEGRDDVIRFIADKAKSVDVLNNTEKFMEAVLSREKEISTSIGYNIAIPHGKTDAVKTPFIAYVNVNKVFIWDEKNHDAVKGIFLIGVPSENTNKLHLKAISEISKKLIDSSFRNELLNCKTNEAAYNLLHSIDQKIIYK